MKTALIAIVLFAGCGDRPLVYEHAPCTSTYVECIPDGTPASTNQAAAMCCQISTQTCEHGPHAYGDCAP